LREQLALAEKAEDTYSEIELIRRVLEKEPGDADLQEQLIRLWLKVEDYDMAEAALKNWKSAPEGLRAEIGAEILYNRDDKASEAVALLEAYRVKDPADMVITRQLARFLGAMGEQEKLVALLDTAPGVSDEADLLLTRAGTKRALGKFDGALADFALVEKLDANAATPERPTYDRLKAVLPKLQEASARLEKNPADVSALIARAQLLTYIGAQNALIRADAERAWKAAPQSMTARILYARTVLTAARAKTELSVDSNVATPSPESIERLLKLDEYIAANPKDAAALAQRSFELNDNPAQYGLALLDADAALAIDPANTSALVEKIYALVKLNKVPDAAATLLVLEKTSPKPERVGHACQYLAEGEMAAFRFEAALDFANRGLKAAPSASLYKTRATILNRLGRIAESNADLASAKKLEKK
jgi:tetratricopeptide (TPR) repeat protein